MRQTCAEGLLEFAAAVEFPRGTLVIAPEDMDATDLARARLSLELLRAPPVIRFRAIVEDWPLTTIVAALH